MTRWVTFPDPKRFQTNHAAFIVSIGLGGYLGFIVFGLRHAYCVALICFFTICECAFPVATRQKEKEESTFMLDLGAFVTNVDQRVSTPSSTFASDTSNLSGFLRLRPRIPIWERLSIEPSFGILLPWRNSVDGGTKIFTFQIDLDFTLRIFSFLKLKLGPGAQTELFVPGAQAVTLNNGMGTSTFYTPDRFSASVYLTGDAGLEIIFFHTLSLNFDLFAVDPGSTSRRHFDAAASLGIPL